MTTVNITIKNCNCSGSGSSEGTSGANDIFDGEPAEGTTPPRGYSTSQIEKRSCKAAVYIYNWVDTWLQYMDDNSWFVNMLVNDILDGFGALAKKAVAALFGAAAGTALATMDGVPGDEKQLAEWGMKAGLLLVEFGKEYSADKLTTYMISDNISLFRENRDDFICQLAKAGTPSQMASNLKAHLGLHYPQPIDWIIYSLSSFFFNIAFFAADWWPEFETALTSTETCCGGLTDGTPIETGSTQACTGANFILDNLVGCLTTADSYAREYGPGHYLTTTTTETAMIDDVRSEYSVPANVRYKAWSYPMMQVELGKYMWAKLSGDSWLTPGTGVNTWEMGRLGAHLQTEIAICELRDCETAQAAYELLSGAIDAWLTANVTDQDLSNHIRLFCQGLIHPAGAYIGLLFTESADLAGFAGSSDCSECAISYSYLSQGSCPQLGAGNRAIPVDGEWRTFYAENFGYWGFAVDDNFIGDVTPVARWNVKMEFRNLVGFTISHPVHGFRAGHNSTNNNDIYNGQTFSSFQAALAATCVGTIGFTAGASYSVEMRLTECSQ
jgi:hypothetical protein